MCSRAALSLIRDGLRSRGMLRAWYMKERARPYLRDHDGSTKACYVEPNRARNGSYPNQPLHFASSPSSISRRHWLVCQRQHSLQNRAEADEHHEQLEQVC